MKPKLLTELLRNVMRDNPRGSQREIRDLCLKHCSAEPSLQIALFDYWFGNSYRDFIVEEFAPNSTAVLSARREREPADPQSRAKAVEQLTNQLKIALLDHQLSDGTPLRDATFGQVAREGGWLQSIAKCGKANEIVGKKLTESDLQSLLRRHTARRAA